MSYIKGSAEALETAAGWLSLSQYLEVGRKRAPNFDCDMRCKVSLPHTSCSHCSRVSVKSSLRNACPVHQSKLQPVTRLPVARYDCA